MTFYPFDTSSTLNQLIDSYKSNLEPVEISFRETVSWIKVGERATHYIHPYPAKLLPQIAHFFLAAKDFFMYPSNVLDPFAGTGTVALETILSGANAYYIDANPLARLIAKVKTTELCPTALRDNLIKIMNLSLNYSDEVVLPFLCNIEFWFDKKTIENLSLIKKAIYLISDLSIRDFFLIVFSSIIKKVSYADDRLSVPVRSKVKKPLLDKQNVRDVFFAHANASIERMEKLRNINLKHKAICLGADAKVMSSYLESRQKIDLIITSPPYMGAQKYIRSSTLSLGWLDIATPNEVRVLESMNMGRDRIKKSTLFLTGIKTVDDLLIKVKDINFMRALVAANYISEMEQTMLEMAKVLRLDSYVIMVIGNNEICGMPFMTSEYLKLLASKFGFILELELVDTIKSRGLMTKRNKTAGIISQEHVLLFKKLS